MKTFVKLFSVAVLVTALMSSCATLPTADFSFDPATDITQYDEVTFTNLSLDALSYEWDFGDGTTSTEASPVHMFTEAGTFLVTLTATNDDGETEVTQTVEVAAFVSTYTLDGNEITVESDMFWYTSPMGGSPYIRLFTPIDGQDNPDLLKLYPNQGVGELPGTYTYLIGNGTEGTYDAGYTANNLSMDYDWTSVGKSGSDLVIEEIVTDIYRITVSNIVLSVGDYNWTTFEFEETREGTLSINYIGAITPL